VARASRENSSLENTDIVVYNLPALKYTDREGNVYFLLPDRKDEAYKDRFKKLVADLARFSSSRPFFAPETSTGPGNDWTGTSC
jgi:hypothetical protein